MHYSKSAATLRPPRLKDCCKSNHCQHCVDLYKQRNRCSPLRKGCHQFPQPHQCLAGCKADPQLQETREPQILETTEMAHHPIQALPETVDMQTMLKRSIMQSNRDYFQQIGKLCCKKKPQKMKLELFASMPDKTIYKKDFTKKNVDPQKLVISRWPDYKSQLPFQKSTQYKAQFPQHPLPQRPPLTQASLPEQKPMFGMSHYKHNYPKWGLQMNQNFKPDNQTTVIKLPLAKGTIYQKDFEPKKIVPFVPRTQVQRPPITGYDIPMNTHYRGHFLPWKPQQTQSMRPKDKPGKYIKPAKMHTEHMDNFTGQPSDLNKCHYKVIEGFKQVMDR